MHFSCLPQAGRRNCFLRRACSPPEECLQKNGSLWFACPRDFLCTPAAAQRKRRAVAAKLSCNRCNVPRIAIRLSSRESTKRRALDTGAGSKVFLWTRAQEDSARLQQSADGLVRAIPGLRRHLWHARQKASAVLDRGMPRAAPAVLPPTESVYASLLSAEPERRFFRTRVLDTLLIDFSGGAPKLAAAAPGLAASWLGYGQNPGFYDQHPPLSALPAFASALGQEAIEGPSSRTETIRRALRMIPKKAVARKTEDASVLACKELPLLLCSSGTLWAGRFPPRDHPHAFRSPGTRLRSRRSHRRVRSRKPIRMSRSLSVCG